jgi:hypothetical protein
MTFPRTSKISLFLTLAFFSSMFLCDVSVAQGPLPESPIPTSSSPSTALFTRPSHGEMQHRFWDNENRILFAATAVMNGADFAVTHANLQSGGQELNPVVRMFGRSTAGLAVNFIGETAGVMSVSYFFHKTGHHKLERAVSLMNLGGSAGAVGYGLSHR